MSRFTRRTLLQAAAVGTLPAWSSAHGQPPPSPEGIEPSGKAALAQDRLPIFDAHVHYSHDAVELVPPQQAVQILRQAGLKGVFVSSSDDEGTQKLLAEAPDLIVPELRPYRTRADVSGWVRENDIVRYLEQRLAKYRYAGIGEFHLYGADADLPVPQRMVALARERDLLLHAHSDIDALERLFKTWPQARILWAHSGFERPPAVREMLRKHPQLWCDLAYRTDQASNNKVDPAWRDAFTEFPDRFMVGTDSYTPERWHYIQGHADWSRRWLGDLPRDVAERIAWKNGEQVFGSLLQPY
jgi:predicted TIM-barrel fold metal-dependent hydrolase